MSTQGDTRYGSTELISWWDQQVLSDATVVVAGVGALGNEAAKNLALLGVGTIVLIDFDLIEKGNLFKSVLFRESDVGASKAQVAARRLEDINPDCHVRVMEGNLLGALGVGPLFAADAIISAVDSYAARLFLNRLSWELGIPWIDGGIGVLDGYTSVHVPGRSGCLECRMQPEDWEAVDRRASCNALARRIPTGRVPTTPTVASIIGAVQVQEVVKLLHRDESNAGCKFHFHGRALNCLTVSVAVREDCNRDCAQYQRRQRIDLVVPRDATVARVVEECAHAVKEACTVELLWDYVISVRCLICDTEWPIRKPRPLMNEEDGLCPKCEQIGMGMTVSSLNEHPILSGLSFGELGMPSDHLYPIEAKSGTRYLARLRQECQLRST